VFDVQTKDNRISTGLNLAHLCKFTNDMSGATEYVYPTQVIKPRFTKFTVTYNAAPSLYGGQLNLGLAGYWKYEIFEVGWIGAVTLNNGEAPATEFDELLPIANTKGVVQGLVTKGKMYVAEVAGSEEVQYVQQSHSVVKLTISATGTGYTTPPTITIGAGSITTATATCTVLAGQVNSVTITDGGSGYTEIPIVTLTGGGFTRAAQIIAEIENQNYIYTG
jgi:hypothetical protein